MILDKIIKIIPNKNPVEQVKTLRFCQIQKPLLFNTLNYDVSLQWTAFQSFPRMSYLSKFLHEKASNQIIELILILSKQYVVQKI